MLARIHRDGLFREVIALFQQLVVDFREAVSDFFGVLVGDIQPEIFGTGALAFENNRVRDDIARGELQTVVIALHEAFEVTVPQICALAAHRLGDEEAFAGVLVVEGGRVELNQA